MALTRIWSAFILIAIGMAVYQTVYVTGQDDVFTRIVTGRSDYSQTWYAVQPSNWQATVSADSLNRIMAPFGYKKLESPRDAAILVYQSHQTDSVQALLSSQPSLKAYTLSAFLNRRFKPADGIVETCKTAVNLCIGLIGIMALFMGFMAIAEKAGGINLLARIIGPFFSRIFPEIPKGHPAMGHMMMNFSANLLGLDNAATPFGIKAMESLQEINPDKKTASNAQIMFLCLHASGLTLIPVSIIAMRAAAKAANPTAIFMP